LFDIKNKEKSTYVNGDCKKLDYPLSSLTFLIIFTGFFMNIFLAIKYGQNYDPLIQAFIIQNYTFMIFNACGLLFYQSFYGIFKNINNEGLGNVFFLTILCSFAVAISQLIIIRLSFISISNFDLLLFFASAGISEESLFRMGLQLSIELILIKVIFKKPKFIFINICNFHFIVHIWFISFICETIGIFDVSCICKFNNFRHLFKKK
jgi:hypothetical protein